MANRVADFVHTMLVDVFNAADTADYAKEAIFAAGSYDLAPKVGCMEHADEWTVEKIREKAAQLNTDKGPDGDFDD